MRSTSTPFVAAAIKLLIFLLQKLGGRQFECSAKYRTGSEYPSLTIQTDIPVFDGHDWHASTGTENQQLFLSTTADKLINYRRDSNYRLYSIAKKKIAMQSQNLFLCLVYLSLVAVSVNAVDVSVPHCFVVDRLC